MLDAFDVNTSAMWPAKYAYHYGHNIVQNDATNYISFTKDSSDILQNILPEKNTCSERLVALGWEETHPICPCQMIQDTKQERELVDNVASSLGSLVSTGHANGRHRKDAVHHCPRGQLCVEQEVNLQVQNEWSPSRCGED
jgi:hypothetical protein